MSATDPHQVFDRTIEAVWRIEAARVIASLTRLTRDLDPAEDLAQEAQLVSFCCKKRNTASNQMFHAVCQLLFWGRRRLLFLARIVWYMPYRS